MSYLIAGLILWAAVHFIPSLAPDLKARWRSALGEAGYMGSFSLLLLCALGLIVYGWRHSLPSHLYTTPELFRPLASVLMFFAFLLFVSSKPATRIKRYIRHPQLCSVIVWSIAHLLVNGDSRSLLLFAGMAIWAVLEIVFINRREGEWQKPPAPALAKEFVLLAIAALVFLLIFWAHPYLSGVRLF